MMMKPWIVIASLQHIITTILRLGSTTAFVAVVPVPALVVPCGVVLLSSTPLRTTNTPATSVAKRRRPQPQVLNAVVPKKKKMFPESVYEDINDCKIAVVPNFLTPSQVKLLRSDAQLLWDEQKFSIDALAGYGSTGKFDVTKDRAVLRLNQWKDQKNGQWSVRQQLEHVLQDVRSDLAHHLHRPNLNAGLAATSDRFGYGSTEISYTRFGPGAFLKRHVDEHHEELKGRNGWLTPTRRSISWLIYLNNNNWHGSMDGGQLRCYERRRCRQGPGGGFLGARPNGDLQIGWLRATAWDPIERPVYMDARRQDGKCSLYIVLSPDDGNGGKEEHISEPFSSQPILYMAGSETFTKALLIAKKRPEYAERFQFIELPKSMLSEYYWGQQQQRTNNDEIIHDIDAIGGTLVLFDSVTLPHEVLATTRQERWATSGWMHEDQQPPPPLVLSLPPPTTTTRTT